MFCIQFETRQPFIYPQPPGRPPSSGIPLPAIQSSTENKYCPFWDLLFLLFRFQDRRPNTFKQGIASVVVGVSVAVDRQEKRFSSVSQCVRLLSCPRRRRTSMMIKFYAIKTDGKLRGIFCRFALARLLGSVGESGRSGREKFIIWNRVCHFCCGHRSAACFSTNLGKVGEWVVNRGQREGRMSDSVRRENVNPWRIFISI